MRKSWQIFWHAFFWVCFLSLVMYLGRDDVKAGNQELFVVFLLYPLINISLFYLNFLVFIPALLDKKRYTQYGISMFFVIILFCLGKYGLGFVYKPYVLMRDGHLMTFSGYMIGSFFTGLSFVILSTGLKFAIDWFTNERVHRELENQRLTAELSFLRSQINPHFLFNSLNSIYSLAYQRSETTPDAILKLSEIMRYMLYECNDNKVDLEKELKYLQNYIDLQRIRFGQKAYIDFKISGKPDGQKIVPLVLIAFIENAFKHGIVNDPLSPIRLFIEIDEGQLHLHTQNKKHTNNRDEMGGIGLNNVKRRLDLLYPGKYMLDIKDDPEKYTYTCELSLVL